MRSSNYSDTLIEEEEEAVVTESRVASDDFSQLVGTWVNRKGQTYTFDESGLVSETLVATLFPANEQIEISVADKRGGGGFMMLFAPAATGKGEEKRDRLIVGQTLEVTEDSVFYRQEEMTYHSVFDMAAIEKGDLKSLSGKWQSPSGHGLMLGIDKLETFEFKQIKDGYAELSNGAATILAIPAGIKDPFLGTISINDRLLPFVAPQPGFPNEDSFYFLQAPPVREQGQSTSGEKHEKPSFAEGIWKNGAGQTIDFSTWWSEHDILKSSANEYGGLTLAIAPKNAPAVSGGALVFIPAGKAYGSNDPSNQQQDRLLMGHILSPFPDASAFYYREDITASVDEVPKKSAEQTRTPLARVAKALGLPSTGETGTWLGGLGVLLILGALGVYGIKRYKNKQ